MQLHLVDMLGAKHGFGQSMDGTAQSVVYASRGQSVHCPRIAPAQAQLRKLRNRARTYTYVHVHVLGIERVMIN